MLIKIGSKNGSVTGICQDGLLNLSRNRLGKVEVTRATALEYNNELQVWEAFEPITGVKIASHPDRAQALKQEIEWLESRICHTQ